MKSNSEIIFFKKTTIHLFLKWLDKSHRSPVSCKEISREQVANRLQSRCKQGLMRTTIKACTSSNFGQIRFRTAELATLGQLEKSL